MHGKSVLCRLSHDQLVTKVVKLQRELEEAQGEAPKLTNRTLRKMSDFWTNKPQCSILCPATNGCSATRFGCAGDSNCRVRLSQHFRGQKKSMTDLERQREQLYPKFLEAVTRSLSLGEDIHKAAQTFQADCLGKAHTYKLKFMAGRITVTYTVRGEHLEFCCELVCRA